MGPLRRTARTLANMIAPYARDLGPFRFWMRDVDGRMARIVGLPERSVVRYSLDGGDETFECSLVHWEQLPIWTGIGRKTVAR